MESFLTPIDCTAPSLIEARRRLWAGEFDSSKLAMLPGIFGAFAHDRVALKRLSRDLSDVGLRSDDARLGAHEFGFVTGCLLFFSGDRALGCVVLGDFFRTRPSHPAAVSFFEQMRVDSPLVEVRRSLRSDDLDEEKIAALPETFAVFATDTVALKRLTQDLNGRGITSNDERLADVGFSFIRTCLDLFTGDRKLAVAAFLTRGDGLEGADYERHRKNAQVLVGKPLLPSLSDRLTLRSLCRDAGDPARRAASLKNLRQKLDELDRFYLLDIDEAAADGLMTQYISDYGFILGYFSKGLGCWPRSAEASEADEQGGVTRTLARINDDDLGDTDHLPKAFSDPHLDAFFRSVRRDLSNDIVDDVFASIPLFEPEAELSLSQGAVLLIDGKPDGVELGAVISGGCFVVSTRSHIDGLGGLKTASFLNDNHWYMEGGRRQFSQAYLTAQDVASARYGAERKAGDVEALAVTLADKCAPQLFLIESAVELAQQARVTNFVCLTRRPLLIPALREALEASGVADVPVVWWNSGRPRPVGAPRRSGRKVITRAARATFDVLERDKSHDDVCAFAANQDEMAVLIGAVTRQHHLSAMIELTNTMKKRRPVLVFMLGSADDPAVATYLESTSSGGDEAARNRFVFFLGNVHNSFKRQHRGRGVERPAPSINGAGPAAPSEALQNAAKRLLSEGVSDQAEALFAAGEWLAHLVDDILERSKICYAVNLSGRLPYGGQVNAVLRERSVLTCDSYLFTVANSARQIPSSADYLSVIDSVQEKYIEEAWARAPDRLFRTGYLWGGVVEITGSTDDRLAPGELARVEVMVATQSGFMDGNLRMLDCLAQAIAEHPNVHVMIRAHPREEDAAPQRYLDYLSERGVGGDRVAVSEADINLALGTADCVLTQTSNIAIEAAACGKTVVKYLAASSFISRTVLDTPYSFNIFDDDGAPDALRSAILDVNVKKQVASGQAAYFEDNPALANGDGAERLLDFLDHQFELSRN